MARLLPGDWGDHGQAPSIDSTKGLVDLGQFAHLVHLVHLGRLRSRVGRCGEELASQTGFVVDGAERGTEIVGIGNPCRLAEEVVDT